MSTPRSGDSNSHRRLSTRAKLSLTYKNAVKLAAQTDANLNDKLLGHM